MYYCNYCDFQCYRSDALLRHIRICHANDPDFQVYCHSCGLPFKKWDSLRKHVQRVHGNSDLRDDSGTAIINYILYIRP